MREFTRDAIVTISIFAVLVILVIFFTDEEFWAGFVFFAAGLVLVSPILLFAFKKFGVKSPAEIKYENHTVRNTLVVLIPLVITSLIIWIISRLN